jgi:copper(I)-binding protein
MSTRILACALLLCGNAFAADHSRHHADQHPAAASLLSVEQVWARALPPNAPAAAVYLTVNNSSDADRLLAASTPIAERTELHSTRQEGELLKMVHEHDVAIPANDSVSFVPGGRHLMLMGLKQPLVAGNQFQLTLVFEKAGAQTVQVDIRDQAPSHGQPGHDHQLHH